jgi:hypothetical protein
LLFIFIIILFIYFILGPIYGGDDICLSIDDNISHYTCFRDLGANSISGIDIYGDRENEEKGVKDDSEEKEGGRKFQTRSKEDEERDNDPRKHLPTEDDKYNSDRSQRVQHSVMIQQRQHLKNTCRSDFEGVLEISHSDANLTRTKRVIGMTVRNPRVIDSRSFFNIGNVNDGDVNKSALRGSGICDGTPVLSPSLNPATAHSFPSSISGALILAPHSVNPLDVISEADEPFFYGTVPLYENVRYPKYYTTPEYRCVLLYYCCYYYFVYW